jgi:hypothetical protein
MSAALALAEDRSLRVAAGQVVRAEVDALTAAGWRPPSREGMA